ncbi:potassium channel family protein [Streptomyces sp. NPDC093094]|uniref:potassium channel family protein n=1 Tax=Streptomyces sp. NPDC093094 TaxID=3366026 RepID=UPI00380091CC
MIRLAGLRACGPAGLRACGPSRVWPPASRLSCCCSPPATSRSPRCRPRASTNEPLSHSDALYFTVTVFSTVGFGDITAKTEAARLVVTAQMLADLVIPGLAVKVVVGAVRRGRQRRDDANRTEAGGHGR